MFRSLTFGAYIRLMYEVFMLLVLASVSEIYTYSNATSVRRTSIVVAFVIVVLCAVFI